MKKRQAKKILRYAFVCGDSSVLNHSSSQIFNAKRVYFKQRSKQC